MTRRQREGLSVEPSFRPFIFSLCAMLFRCFCCLVEVMVAVTPPITSPRTNGDIPELIKCKTNIGRLAPISCRMYMYKYAREPELANKENSLWINLGKQNN